MNFVQDNMKQFYKKLLSFLTHRSQKLEIFALSIVTSLCLHDDIGQQVCSLCISFICLLV